MKNENDPVNGLLFIYWFGGAVGILALWILLTYFKLSDTIQYQRKTIEFQREIISKDSSMIEDYERISRRAINVGNECISILDSIKENEK